MIYDLNHNNFTGINQILIFNILYAHWLDTNWILIQSKYLTTQTCDRTQIRSFFDTLLYFLSQFFTAWWFRNTTSDITTICWRFDARTNSEWGFFQNLFSSLLFPFRFKHWEPSQHVVEKKNSDDVLVCCMTNWGIGSRKNVVEWQKLELILLDGILISTFYLSGLRSRNRKQCDGLTIVVCLPSASYLLRSFCSNASCETWASSVSFLFFIYY